MAEAGLSFSTSTRGTSRKHLGVLRFDRNLARFRPCAAGAHFGLLSGAKFCSFYLGMTQTHPLTTTTFELPGYRVIKSFGVVRGIIVRSRSIVGNIGAGLQSLFGGNISLYTSMCEQAREDAFNEMIAHAGQLGANAVIGVRYDATEISAGITEVLCYGTAVHVEPQP
jgi:uncharacterized protein YbjQ (UPF0145 family)